MSQSPAAQARTDAKQADIVEAPPLAPSGTPLCYIVDDDGSLRQFLSLVLHGLGVDSSGFADGAALRKAADECVPDLIIFNVALDSADVAHTMSALSARGFRGAVQLTSSRGAAVLEHAKGIGTKHNLYMLPVLKKPYEAETIVKIVQDLKLDMPKADVQIGLAEVLANNWIEFWYQPKIDLRRKKLAGAEAYARARHPQHGILLPGAFMPGADEASTVKLSELALKSAFKTADVFSSIGVHVPLSINIQPTVVEKLPIEEIVKAHRPNLEDWPGLIIDMREEHVMSNLPLVTELSKRLAPHKVQLAVDEFGAHLTEMSRIAELPFAELKIDRKFTADCGIDKVNMPLCKSVIDLAHRHRRHAVAMGIEKAADTLALVSMGCDFGQGFLLGEPMAEERFVSLLRQRSGSREPAPAR